MDITYYSLLLTAKDDQEFYMLFDSYVNSYKPLNNYYEHEIKSKNFHQGHNSIPKYLYKYLKFDSGIQSLKKSTIQFSHPLSFREFKDSPLVDRTEFWTNRFYFDRLTLIQLRNDLERKFKDLDYSDPKKLLSVLGIQFVNNTVERNKILCLSSSPTNEYLWNTNREGICIEYDSTLFKKQIESL